MWSVDIDSILVISVQGLSMICPVCRLISSYLKFVALKMKHNQRVNINVRIIS